MKALVVSSGLIENINLLKDYCKEVDYILAVDGGTNYLIKANIKPDAVIGDLDSIDIENIEKIKAYDIPIMKFPVKKNATDSELAIDFLYEKGYKNIIQIGSLGSRIDHSIANVYLLDYMKEKGIEGYLINEQNIIYLVDGIKRVKKQKKYISVIPITDDGIIVSLEGFEYPLDHKFIKRGSTLGVSNEIKGEEATIRIHSGKALVILSEDMK